MNYVSLFSGIGGFDLAFDRAGAHCVAQVEKDKNCLTLLSRRFPEVERVDDVRSFGKFGKFESASVDIITGGFPCQDLSVAGKRAGLAGDRSGLWFEFARIIDEFEPKWVVIENVPGLLSSWSGVQPPSDLQEGQEWEGEEESDFSIILRWLVDRGYSLAWRVFNAQYFGVPQRRRRVFVVASFGSGRCAEILFESTSLPGHLVSRRKKGQETAYSLRANPSHSGDKGDGGINTNLVAGTISSKWEKGTGGPAGDEVQNLVVSPIEARGHKGINSDNLDHMVAAPLVARQAKGPFTDPANDNIISVINDQGGDRIDITENVTSTLRNQQNRHAPAVAWEATRRTGEVYRESGELSPTLQSHMGTDGNNVPLVGVRRLTPTECERLQGFPDGWTAGQSDSARYRQLGNAVAVPVVEWIARRIMALESEGK